MEQAFKEKIDKALSDLVAGRYGDARTEIEAMRRLAPDLPTMRLLWGETLMRADNNPDGAIAEARAVLAVEPDNHHAQILIASAASVLGDKPLTIRALEAVIEAKPDFADAYLRLTRAAPEAAARHRAAIERLAAPGAVEEKERSHALSALGLLRERDEDFGGAFGAFLASKQVTPTPYNAKGYELSLRRSRARFTAEMFEAPALEPSAVAAQRLLFIVGLPRSGSTLLEQMLCRHSEIETAGETAELQTVLQQHFTDAANKAARAARIAPVFAEIEGVLAAGPAAREAAAAAYLDRLSRLTPARPASLWIDKMPANLFLAGAIATLFPTARFIVTDRDPRDVFVSALRTRFAAPQPFSESVERFAHHHKIVKAFTALWRRRLGERVAVLRYEDLVATPELEMRRLIDHLGLEWDDACLRSDAPAGAVVSTASAWQVREPVHTKSVGAWRRYEAQLATLEPLLTAAGGVRARRAAPPSEAAPPPVAP
ncbi:MAG: sulfotransferase [Pseudomonadota bacterium]